MVEYGKKNCKKNAKVGNKWWKVRNFMKGGKKM